MKYILNENVNIRDIAGEKLLFLGIGNNGNFNGAYQLNDISYDILKMVQDNKNVEDIIDNIMNEYDMEKDIVERDIMNFISEMIGKHIVIEV